MSLRETSVFLHRPPKEVIQVGDIVLLRNEGKPRAFWKLANVTKLVRGRDGAVRSAKIECLINSREKTTELRWPIQHLVPLELRAERERPDIVIQMYRHLYKRSMIPHKTFCDIV